MAGELVIVPVRNTNSTQCQNNCVTILLYGEEIQPIPSDYPPAGYEWVYDVNGNHVLDENSRWVYTLIH